MDRARHLRVRLKLIVDVDKCQVNLYAGREGIIGVRETVCFAYPAAHLDALNGMAKLLLWHRDEELDWSVALSLFIDSPQCPDGECKAA